MKHTNTDNLIYPSIDSLLKVVENKYILSLLVSKRARLLFEGELPLIENDFINYVTIAINEVDQKKLYYTDPEVHIN